jgi:hypothetical protein
VPFDPEALKMLVHFLGCVADGMWALESCSGALAMGSLPAWKTNLDTWEQLLLEVQP